jgi:hypothetical protein
MNICKPGLYAARQAPIVNSLSDVYIRDQSQEQDIKDVSATPLVLSLEGSPMTDFTNAFEGKDTVYFCAGAGGKGGEERTRQVDYEGALKIFDAIEGVQGEKPLLILVSSVDVRDPTKIPAHYVGETPNSLFGRSLKMTKSRPNKISAFRPNFGALSPFICIGNMRQTRTS